MFNGGNWPGYVSVPFRYGIYAGILAFPFMLLLYYMGYHPFLINVFFDYRIALLSIVIFFSLKEARDYYGKGNLYFWQGMAGSLVLTFAFATLVAVLLYVYMAFNADFLHSYVTLSLEQLSAFSEEDIEQVGREAYEEGMKLLPQVSNGFVIIRFFTQSFIISLFVSIIISAVLRHHSVSKSNDERKT